MLSTIILIIILLIMSGFFSGSETAILSASEAKIHKLKNDGNNKAKLVLKLKEKKEAFISTILLGNNFVNIAASSVATGLCIDLFGSNNTTLFFVSILMTLCILIFSELLPKTYAVRHSEGVALKVASICMALQFLLSPITKSVSLLINWVLHIFTKNTSPIEISGLETIKNTIDLQHKDGSMRSDYKHMLAGVIDLEEILVEEIMIHRNEIFSINIDLPIKDIMSLITKSPYSRIPLWRKKPENIIGVLHIRDINNVLLKKSAKSKINELLTYSREPWFIPNTTNLKAQLLAFRQAHVHMAFVVNEYGDLQGLITLEDIIEEVVGHIEDEYDNHSQKLQLDKDNSIVVSGNMTIRDLNRELDWDLSDEDASTIGGLLFHLAQHIPHRGESFQVGNYILSLVQKKKNRILKVKVQLLIDVI